MMKSNDTLSGVKCEVRDCYYHCMDNACAAPSIKVSCDTQSAECKTDTVCDTFQKTGAML